MRRISLVATVVAVLSTPHLLLAQTPTLPDTVAPAAIADGDDPVDIVQPETNLTSTELAAAAAFEAAQQRNVSFTPKLKTDPELGQGLSTFNFGQFGSPGEFSRQSTGGTAGPSLQPLDSTFFLENRRAEFMRQATGGKDQNDDLVQIRVRVVEVVRSDAFSASSVLDYIGSTGSSSKFAGATPGSPNVNGLGQSIRGLTRFAQDPALITASAMGAVSGGGLLVNLTHEHINFLASVLATDFNGDIITAPEVTTISGQNVEFVAGSKIPFQVGQSIVGSDNSAVQNFFFKHVGTYISVTPTIENDKSIKFSIVVRLSQGDTQNISVQAAGNAPTIGDVNIESNIRAIANVVKVQDNQGIVMAGLIGESETDAESKVPVLGDVPWIGSLFRSKTTTRQKTETLIFVEARSLNSAEDEGWSARAYTAEDFQLAQDYVMGRLLENPLECGIFRAGHGSYLPSLSPDEECFWARCERKMLRQATNIDDLAN